MCAICVIARSARKISSRAATAAAIKPPPLASVPNSTVTPTFKMSTPTAVARHVHTQSRGFAAQVVEEVEGEDEEEIVMCGEVEPVLSR